MHIPKAPALHPSSHPASLSQQSILMCVHTKTSPLPPEPPSRKPRHTSMQAKQQHASDSSSLTPHPPHTADTSVNPSLTCISLTTSYSPPGCPPRALFVNSLDRLPIWQKRKEIGMSPRSGFLELLPRRHWAATALGTAHRNITAPHRGGVSDVLWISSFFSPWMRLCWTVSVVPPYCLANSKLRVDSVLNYRKLSCWAGFLIGKVPRVAERL